MVLATKKKMQGPEPLCSGMVGSSGASGATARYVDAGGHMYTQEPAAMRTAARTHTLRPAKGDSGARGGGEREG